ncbi:MAG: hypothetical protein JXB30_06460 [Anaerolineae bacterium]|nr:hypothetical protein [Anaerolineae bacterium]
MSNDGYQLSLDKIERFVKGSIRPIWLAGTVRLASPVRRWWGNPLLSHARRERPMPDAGMGHWVAISAIGVTLLSILAWVVNWGLLGAFLFDASLGIVLAIGLAAPVLSADRVARQMRFSRQNPHRLTDLEPRLAVWGFTLVTLWRLRWLIIIGLAMTPALIIGLLRLDVANFGVWQESVQALGEATPASISNWLPADGHIPYFRLVIRALSAGLMPWVMLPLLASLGVTSAFQLHDAGLSPLVGLIGAVFLISLSLLVWDGLTRMPLLAGGLEIVRLFLVVGLLVGISGAVAWVNQQNEEILKSLRLGRR